MNVNILTVVPSDSFPKLLADKKLANLDLIPLIHSAIKRAISEYLHKKSGVQVGIPLATLSNVTSGRIKLEEVGTGIGDYLPLRTGSTIWELEVKDDIMASIPYQKLLSYNQEFSETPEDLHEELIDMFKDELTLGPLKGEQDVISFIPFIGLNHCRYVAALDSKWETKLLEVPGVKQVKLTSFNHIFN
jgi:hypothetical protein